MEEWNRWMRMEFQTKHIWKSDRYMNTIVVIPFLCSIILFFSFQTDLSFIFFAEIYFCFDDVDVVSQCVLDGVLLSFSFSLQEKIKMNNKNKI